MNAGQSITITKPGKFQGLTGEVISNNELADKPLTVDLNPYGVWSFKLDEVEPIGKQSNIATNKPVETIETENKGNLSTEKIKAVKPTEKRQYNKKDKSIEVKSKRKYTPRKQKSI